MIPGEFNVRKLIMIALVLLLSGRCACAVALPIITINKATVDFSRNQVTYNGSGFEPTKKSPTVLFAGSPLTVISYNDAQIVAALPANTVAGNFSVLIVNSLVLFMPNELTYGAAGPHGPLGPAGPLGQPGDI